MPNTRLRFGAFMTQTALFIQHGSRKGILGS
jgi:hypothetical protein